MNKNILIILGAIIIIGSVFYFGSPTSPATNEEIKTSNYSTITDQASISTPVATSTPATTLSTSTKPVLAVTNKNFMHTVTIETNKGTIVFETYDMDAPKAAANFITLAQKNFYDGVIFHRVIKGFMIQGGDPTGTGRGGPGYTFADELNPSTVSYKAGYVRGTVAMANSGKDTNGSQFFIMHNDTPQLPHLYTIFGKVISGLDVVDAIANVATDPSDDRPIDKITIKKVTVAEKK